MNKREKQVIQYQLDAEKEVIKDLERQYQAALNQINEKIRILQSDELTQSRIYQLNYQKALKGQVQGILDKLHGDEFSTLQKYLHDCYTDAFVGTMYNLHGQGMPFIIPIDQNAAVKAILTDSKIKESLYETLGVDVTKLKKAISSEITRGIASNLPYAEIARNISFVAKAPLSRAKTIANTEGHRIQQASTYDAQNEAKAKGADVVKQWDASLDGATRPTHRKLDGQIREVDEPYEADGKKAMFPGDFGRAEEDCNCRCVSLTRARAALDADELKTLQDRAEYFGLDKSKSFDDFKERYMEAAKEIPDPVVQVIAFTPAKTKAEAEKYAEKFSSVVSFDGVSIDNANKINEQFAILSAKYPIKKLDEIVPGKKSVMTGNYHRLTINGKQLGKTLDEGHEVFLKNQEGYKESLKILKDRFAGRKAPFAIEKNIKQLENKLRFKRWGVSEDYNDKVKVTVMHEYGHILSDQYFGLINGADANPNMRMNWSIKKTRDRWNEIFKKAIEKGDVYDLSEYGSKDSYEYFAECFAARECGERLPDYVEEFMSEVLKNGIL